jgi:hypothetical protein
LGYEFHTPQFCHCNTNRIYWRQVTLSNCPRIPMSEVNPFGYVGVNHVAWTNGTDIIKSHRTIILRYVSV